MVIAIIHLIILFLLHTTYVGPRISIPRGGGLSMTCLEHALSSRPLPSSKPLLRREEVLQINIIPDECGSKRCSKVRELNEHKSEAELRAILLSQEIDFNNASSPEMIEWSRGSMQYWHTPQYRFATDKALLDMRDDMLYHYKVPIVNVTLSARCLASGSDDGTSNRLGRLFLPYYGYDSAIINQLMYGIKTVDGKYMNGYLWNIHDAEQFSYSKDTLERHEASRKNKYLKLIDKVGVLMMSVICFFFSTSVTAIIVRVLTSSGVLILFPFFTMFRLFGMEVDESSLDYAHPWLGTTRRHIESRDQYPFNHFVCANLGKLLLNYSMYEACQLAWVETFYKGGGIFVRFPLWIYATLLLYEYFSLIYVRSALR